MTTMTPKYTEELNELSELLRANKADESKRLLNRIPDLLKLRDDSGRGPAHWAAVGGCLPLLQYTVSVDANAADEPDAMGWTPLMIACSAGRPEIVRYLVGLDHVEVNLHNNNGQTALHYACSKNHPEIVHVLLQNNADVNATDKLQATPLHRAASQGHDRVVQQLLAKPNIRVDVRNSEGSTPLFLAVEENREDAAIALCHKGADPTVKNKDDKCALQVVKTSDFLRKLKNAAKIE